MKLSRTAFLVDSERGIIDEFEIRTDSRPGVIENDLIYIASHYDRASPEETYRGTVASVYYDDEDWVLNVNEAIPAGPAQATTTIVVFVSFGLLNEVMFCSRTGHEI